MKSFEQVLGGAYVEIEKRLAWRLKSERETKEDGRCFSRR